MMTEDTFTLTPSQESAIVKLTEWWDSDSANIILSGAPGSGKTFLVKHFVNSLKGATPLFTAPTNEAVRQLELALGGDLKPRTTYNALGLSLSTRNRKQSIYQRSLPEDFYDHNLLVVDEASMAGKAKEEEKYLLMDYVESAGIRCIWLGDWAQLPPVEDSKGFSPAFYQDWEILELTEVVRHGGDILKFAYTLRDIIQLPIRNLPEIPKSIQKVRATNSMNFSEASFQLIVEDKARILVWTNRSTKYCPRPGVEEYNHAIRSRLFGEKKACESEIYPTDRILFASPLVLVKGGTKEKPEELSLKNFEKARTWIMASVNSRAEVVKTEIVDYMGFECWKAEIEFEGKRDGIMYLPTNKGKFEVKKVEDQYLQEALSKSGYHAHRAWEKYHAFKACFADIKHTYCITGHRAQGSTIEKVFVDVANILQNRNRLVAFKNLYVCVTRAQKELVLFL